MFETRDTATLIPWKCPCCTSCKLIIEGHFGCAGKGQCIYGGPFKGYQEIRDNPSQLETQNKAT